VCTGKISVNYSILQFPITKRLAFILSTPVSSDLLNALAGLSVKHLTEFHYMESRFTFLFQKFDVRKLTEVILEKGIEAKTVMGGNIYNPNITMNKVTDVFRFDMTFSGKRRAMHLAINAPVARLHQFCLLCVQIQTLNGIKFKCSLQVFAIHMSKPLMKELN
jgi:hypothetical protein